MKSKLLSGLIIVSMVLAIAVMLTIMIWSIRYSTSSIALAPKLDDKIYLCGILIAIAAGTIYFIEMFIRTVGEAIRDIKHG